ncbi:MAG: epoxyqueuosine reductase QueH [Oscillospiraceae bacterium]|nr:epoxyqueuosine reductase QueH [Oscillospiraceae bacterium]
MRLLLHACCAPCSTVVLERLSEKWDITLFYHNPNIYPSGEYEKRLGEVRCLAAKTPAPVLAPEYDHAEFLDSVRGLESEPEGGARCIRCYELRLRRTAREARELGFDAFASTLTVGPRKRASDINACGDAAAREYGAVWLAEDFKKRDGYKRSVELSREYGLYRQSYCGCEFARNISSGDQSERMT